MANMALSDAGLAFLTRHEGLRTHLYNDSRGHATIGYGHLVHAGAVGTNPRAEAPFRGGLAQPMAAALLRRDVRACEAAIRVGVTRNLTQAQFDALVSFTFNVGVAGFQGSTLRRAINAGADPADIRAAFMMWTKNPELRGRRADEANLFLAGSYRGV